jgi:hypothetical protein
MFTKIIKTLRLGCVLGIKLLHQEKVFVELSKLKHFGKIELYQLVMILMGLSICYIMHKFSIKRFSAYTLKGMQLAEFVTIGIIIFSNVFDFSVCDFKVINADITINVILSIAIVIFSETLIKAFEE